MSARNSENPYATPKAKLDRPSSNLISAIFAKRFLIAGIIPTILPLVSATRTSIDGPVRGFFRIAYMFFPIVAMGVGLSCIFSSRFTAKKYMDTLIWQLLTGTLWGAGGLIWSASIVYFSTKSPHYGISDAISDLVFGSITLQFFCTLFTFIAVAMARSALRKHELLSSTSISEASDA